MFCAGDFNIDILNVDIHKTTFHILIAVMLNYFYPAITNPLESLNYSAYFTMVDMNKLFMATYMHRSHKKCLPNFKFFKFLIFFLSCLLYVDDMILIF